jgi:hypothetical protein
MNDNDVANAGDTQKLAPQVTPGQRERQLVLLLAKLEGELAAPEYGQVLRVLMGGAEDEMASSSS